jgi:hypothetical protein
LYVSFSADLLKPLDITVLLACLRSRLLFKSVEVFSFIVRFVIEDGEEPVVLVHSSALLHELLEHNKLLVVANQEGECHTRVDLRNVDLLEAGAVVGEVASMTQLILTTHSGLHQVGVQKYYILVLSAYKVECLRGSASNGSHVQSALEVIENGTVVLLVHLTQTKTRRDYHQNGVLPLTRRVLVLLLRHVLQVLGFINDLGGHLEQLDGVGSLKQLLLEDELNVGVQGVSLRSAGVFLPHEAITPALASQLDDLVIVDCSIIEYAYFKVLHWRKYLIQILYTYTLLL